MSDIVRKFVQLESIRDLQRGDIVRNIGGTKTYVVCSNYGSRANAVLSVDITNPEEWAVLRPEPEALTASTPLRHPFDKLRTTAQGGGSATMGPETQTFEPDERRNKLILEHKKVRVMRVAPIKELVQGQFFRFHALEAPRIVIALDKEKLIAPFIDPEYKGYRPDDVFKLGVFGHKLDVEFLGMEI